jgi:hypothetical protein
MPLILEGDGAASAGFGMDDFLLVRVVVAWGNPEYLRTLDTVVRATEPTELPRLLELPKEAAEPLPLAGVMTTDDGGELPGVSMTLPVVGLSIVTMVEIESRKC